MEDTSGFYKFDGGLIFGPNYVLNAAYELRRENQASYTYPVDGWHWFNDEKQAREHFKIEKQPE
jgi:hypothetical protein